MKYGYDKSFLKGLGVGNFLKIDATRNAKIAEAPNTIPESVYSANRLAASLHPHVQFVKVVEIIDRGSAKTFALAPNPEMGTTSLAYFRAGQYISVALKIGGATLCKPYSLCSGPKEALEGVYRITVQRNPNGYASDYILDEWKVGTEVMISAPLGDFYYSPIRDAKHVVALAGGSGITPFFSMASAIADGIEDSRLTILYGNGTYEGILLREELEEIAARSEGRVKIIHVLSKETREGCESGFISADLIRRIIGNEDASIFLCGPRAMYTYEDTELPKLHLPRRRIRRELYGEFGDPAADPKWDLQLRDRTFAVTVRVRGQEYHISCKGDQTLLCAMEQAGIPAPSDCRSGVCGWCHSLLVSGEVFIPEKADGRRLADAKFGWIHPCCSYPMSDIVLDVPALLLPDQEDEK